MLWANPSFKDATFFVGLCYDQGRRHLLCAPHSCQLIRLPPTAFSLTDVLYITTFTPSQPVMSHDLFVILLWNGNSKWGSIARRSTKSEKRLQISPSTYDARARKTCTNIWAKFTYRIFTYAPLSLPLDMKFLLARKPKCWPASDIVHDEHRRPDETSWELLRSSCRGGRRSRKASLTKSRRKWDMKEYVKHAGSLSDNVHGLRSSRRKVSKKQSMFKIQGLGESVKGDAGGLAVGYVDLDFQFPPVCPLALPIQP